MSLSAANRSRRRPIIFGLPGLLSPSLAHSSLQSYDEDANKPIVWPISAVSLGGCGGGCLSAISPALSRRRASTAHFQKLTRLEAEIIWILRNDNKATPQSKRCGTRRRGPYCPSYFDRGPIGALAGPAPLPASHCPDYPISRGDWLAICGLLNISQQCQ